MIEGEKTFRPGLNHQPKKIFQIVTLFPQFFDSCLSVGVVGQAIKSSLIEVKFINPRDFAENKFGHVDDRPYGGGDGMVLQAKPLSKSIESLDQVGHLVSFSPQGKLWTQQMAQDWSQNHSRITMICGRYSGVDQRFINSSGAEEVSIGDYVLSGGEACAVVLIETLSRLQEGVLGHPESSLKDSLTTPGRLEAPVFTRPEVWQGMSVPSVLLSGDHALIEQVREDVSWVLARFKRPDLWQRAENKPAWNELCNRLKNFNQEELNSWGIRPEWLSPDVR